MQSTVTYDLPDDALTVMRAELQLACPHHSASYGNPWVCLDCGFTSKERAATLAERERCAAIAEEHEVWRDNPAINIADAIRNPI